jgi:hypothetical protein
VRRPWSARTCIYAHTLGRIQLGGTLVRLAADSTYPDVRRDTLAALARLARLVPEPLALLVRDALVGALGKPAAAPAPAAKPKEDGTEEKVKVVDRQPRLAGVLLAAAGFGADVTPDVRFRLLADLAIVAHHPGVCACPRRAPRTR